jgi:predicted nucleic acid-binding protein
MKYFFDTSALVKLFQEEAGSNIVEDIVNDQNNELWLLDLSKIEFYSCIFRRYRQQEITANELNIVINAFDEQLSSFKMEFLGPSILYEAEQLMLAYGKVHGLRALDSLQLGACKLIYEPGLTFLCADQRLCAISVLCNIECINPVASSYGISVSNRK